MGTDSRVSSRATMCITDAAMDGAVAVGEISGGNGLRDILVKLESCLSL